MHRLQHHEGVILEPHHRVGLDRPDRRFCQRTEQGGVGEPGADAGGEQPRQPLPVGIDQQVHERRAVAHRSRCGGGQQAGRSPSGGSGRGGLEEAFPVECHRVGPQRCGSDQSV